jgi:hypothetical protein
VQSGTARNSCQPFPYAGFWCATLKQSSPPTLFALHRSWCQPRADPWVVRTALADSMSSWPFRRDGGTRSARRRRAGVLPRPPVTQGLRRPGPQAEDGHKLPRAPKRPYSPSCLEGAFSEVRLYRVLRSSALPARNTQAYLDHHTTVAQGLGVRRGWRFLLTPGP